jgi:AraC-like DNA-binding protein
MRLHVEIGCLGLDSARSAKPRASASGRAAVTPRPGMYFGFQPDRAALSVRRLVGGEGFVVDDVRCNAGRSGWSEPEHTSGYALVLTRSGCFERRADGTETFVDAAVAYFRAPGEEQLIAHPAECGDRCTSIGLDPTFVASLWGGDPEGSGGPIFSTPVLDLAHRKLLANCRAGASGADVAELITNIAAIALAQRDETRVVSGRPASAAVRRRIVGDARRLLAENPARTLTDLARELTVSPHHLSRIFSTGTGASLTTYRKRLRARAALERIADGERSFARVAADLGFSDHAHLTRTIRSETGLTPSALRRIWGAAAGE